MDCAQQANGSDCGVYTIMFAESIARMIATGEANADCNWNLFAEDTKLLFTPEVAMARRFQLKTDIAAVAAERGRRCEN